MSLRCLAYRVLDRARRTALLRWACYHGTSMQIRPDVTAIGTVRSVGVAESDGDVTFHLEIDQPDDRGPFRHCELTPCDPDAVRQIVRALQVGDRIYVRGDERFDPHHVFDGGGPDGATQPQAGWWEFHGITDLTVLHEPRAA